MSHELSDPLLEWLYSLSGPSLKWDIDTASAFTRWLGHPQRGFASVHIAGTNGKGSVAAHLSAIARASGLRVGLFTSPHLVRPEERVRLDEHDIDSALFRRFIERLRDEASRAMAAEAVPRHPSFFEMMTAVAMLAFEHHRVDVGVFETGLGGRLDATNILTPHLAVVTTISRDHQKTLGRSLTAIAREKAGIIKPGIPVLAGWIGAAPLEVLRHVARERGAPFHDAARELSLQPTADGGFDLATPLASYRGLCSALEGDHQRRNAALAVRAAELLRTRGIGFHDGAIREGLTRVRWAGRLERISGSPRFLLDAAHNAEGAKALGKYLERHDRAHGRPRRRAVVFGLTEGRRAGSMIRPIAGFVDRIVVTRPATSRAQPPSRVAAELDGAVDSRRVILVPQLAEALERAAAAAGPAGEVLVTGSLYLVGGARQILIGLAGPGAPRHERVPTLERARSKRTAG
ncbi:MAG: bifunctional folylpolyglutamate synthase/dihydrofolate synthase [Acidobacteriota bacterium]|nr:MAG: bifunctional folylpolyglutamate synthase/dihydrofolate synthase [Acidobacteriota bacterium]